MHFASTNFGDIKTFVEKKNLDLFAFFARRSFYASSLFWWIISEKRGGHFSGLWKHWKSVFFQSRHGEKLSQFLVNFYSIIDIFLFFFWFAFNRDSVKSWERLWPSSKWHMDISQCSVVKNFSIYCLLYDNGQCHTVLFLSFSIFAEKKWKLGEIAKRLSHTGWTRNFSNAKFFITK